MNKSIFSLIVWLQLFFSTGNNLLAQKTDLINKWDTIRPLINPDKGWYHHMLDNGISKYLIQDEKELTAFPGMDHLYLRLAWAYLEPEEGKFDWSYIDDIAPLGFPERVTVYCWLAIQLFDKKSENPVEIGLAENLKNNGYFLIQKLTF